MVVKLALGKKGVVSDHPIATQVGVDILKRDGNAFDAAIAVSAVLSVVQPHMGGPGGDGFLLGFLGDEVVAYASSGRSPSGFDVETYLRERPLRGPLTVTIPGLVKLWGDIYEEYATMPLDTLLEPAIKLAYYGFQVGWSLSRASLSVHTELSRYKWSKYFSGLKLGELYRNVDMARALRLIATREWEEFYYGELAEQFVTELVEQGVNIGLDDLMDHESLKVSSLKYTVDGKTLHELPPNTQGLTTLQIISALYELELHKEPFDSPNRVSKWEEPTKNVYLFRDLNLGDPDYMKIDPQSYVTYKSVENYIKKEVAPANNPSNGDTTFFIVSDGEAIIGFIQSLFYPFGSGLVALGFPIQNRGIGFAKREGLPNSPAPRKLPLHTLSILGVDAGENKYIIGCVGGDLRPQLHLRVYENMFIYGMHPAKAVNAPRFVYTKLEPTEVSVEEPLKLPTLRGSLKAVKLGYLELQGHVHVGVLKKGSNVELACDFRSEGVALAL